MRFGICCAFLTTGVTFAGVLGGMLAVSARAEGCPNEQVRGTEVYALKLPDCRAYEQVSPVSKKFTDAVGAPGLVEASPVGGGVTFFSLVPFSGVLGAAEFPTYLSTHGSEEWSTQGLLPKSDPASLVSVVGLTEDLSEAVVSDYPSSPPLAPGATAGQLNYYVRDSATGSYQLLAPNPNFPNSGEYRFADSSRSGSRILFEAREMLLPNAAPKEALNLYEWDNGRLSVAGALSNGSAPTGGAVAGPGGPALGGHGPGGATSEFYTQNTISEDDSRVFFSSVETGQIYVREDGINTVRVSASHRSVPETERPAYWRAATPDGRYVFFTSEEKLTKDATALPENPDLYRFDVESKELVDLTTSASEGANVLGTLGVSRDGSYVYFVATSALASGATAGQDSLYEWHNGTTIFITRLEGSTDETDWLSYCRCNGNGPAGGGKSSRVTPDGQVVLFSSTLPLTGYDSAEHFEFYLYDAAANTLTCVSCNPDSKPATSNAYLTHGISESAPSARNPFLTRNLSDDGRRVFFQTEEALVPEDTNNQMDVYEWENGNLYLISTGRDSSGSSFGDASIDGNDVFFFTRQSLVGQDQDDNADVYDARVNGGIPAQSPLAVAEPCTGEICRGAPGLPPVLGVPSSATFSGVGNLTQGPEVRPAKKLKPNKKGRSKKKKKKAMKSARARKVARRYHS
jgi:hypothetical protein